MTKEQEPLFPPEEIIAFSPSKETEVLLNNIDIFLAREFVRYLDKRSREVATSAITLELFLKPGETISRLNNLKIGEEFILVTKYPRTESSDKVLTVNRFVDKKEKGGMQKYVETTSGKALPANIYVIRTPSQRAKKLPTL